MEMQTIQEELQQCQVNMQVNMQVANEYRKLYLTLQAYKAVSKKNYRS